VKETAFRDPASAIDQLVMHDRYLSGRPAEANKSELQPEAKRLSLGGLGGDTYVRGLSLGLRECL